MQNISISAETPTELWEANEGIHKTLKETLKT